MHKRSSFSYESEVRIVLEGAIPLHTYERVSWNPQAAAERIVVSPYAKTWFFETVRDVVGRYSPSLAQQVEWSEM